MQWSCRVQRIHFRGKLLPLRMMTFQAFGRRIGSFDEAKVRGGLVSGQYDPSPASTLRVAYVVEGSSVCRGFILQEVAFHGRVLDIAISIRGAW